MRRSKSTAEPTPTLILEALWRALKDHYPMMEYAGAHGDAWLDEFRPRVEAAPTRGAAYELMEELVCRLNDYHTRLQWPDPPKKCGPPIAVGPVFAAQGAEPSFRALRPPAEFRRDPGLVIAVIRACGTDVVRPGDRVLAVDGRPVVDALADAWLRSVGSSARARLAAAAWRMMLGPPEEDLALTVARDPDPEPHTVRIPRTPPPPEPTVSMRLCRGVPVVRIARWWNPDGEDLVAEVDQILDSVRGAPALAFDVRGNGGGRDDLADEVTGRFVARPVVASISFHRKAPGLDFTRSVEWTRPRGPWRFEGRVAVLTDEGCKSACEHFVSGMAEAGALMCGTATDGACGWIHRIGLPGGAQLFVSPTFPLHTGGLPSALLGIAPHLWRPPTLDDLRSGRDAALEAAIDWLESGEPLPTRTHTFAS